MSFAEPDVNVRWVENQEYQYEVWTDSDKTLALYYGAINGPGAAFPGRVTKVLDEQGRLVLEYVDGINVGTHPDDVLADVTKLFGK